MRGRPPDVHEDIGLASITILPQPRPGVETGKLVRRTPDSSTTSPPQQKSSGLTPLSDSSKTGLASCKQSSLMANNGLLCHVSLPQDPRELDHLSFIAVAGPRARYLYPIHGRVCGDDATRLSEQPDSLVRLVSFLRFYLGASTRAVTLRRYAQCKSLP